MFAAWVKLIIVLNLFDVLARQYLATVLILVPKKDNAIGAVVKVLLLLQVTILVNKFVFVLAGCIEYAKFNTTFKQ